MKLKGKNVLVTGGAGFIGSHLVDRIISEEPAKLVVVDNFFLGREENLDHAKQAYEELHVYRLDASDLAAMRRLVTQEHIDVVFDLAVIPLPTSLEYPVWTIQTNISIVTTFCEILRCGEIETLVHCSSSEAYGTAKEVPMREDQVLVPITPYAASKAGADQIVLSYHRTFNVDAVIVRPFNNFGPRQNPGTYAGIIPIIIHRVHENEPIHIFGDGEQTRDFIFVRDTADACVRIYEKESTRGKVINVATGVETSINQLVKKVLDAMNVLDHPVLHKDPRPGDVRRHLGDISLAKEFINFSPSVISKESLVETINWYLK